MNIHRHNLLEWARGYEYYADAYVGEGAPFPDKKPDSDTLCQIIQDGTRLVFKYFNSLKEDSITEKREDELVEDLELLASEKMEIKYNNFYSKSELVCMINILLSKLTQSVETGHWIGQDKAYEALHQIIETAQNALQKE